MKTLAVLLLLALPYCTFGQFRQQSNVYQALSAHFILPPAYPKLFLSRTGSTNSPEKSMLLKKQQPSMQLELGDLTKFEYNNTMYNYSNDYKVKATYEFDNMGNFKGSGFEIGYGGKKRKKN